MNTIKQIAEIMRESYPALYNSLTKAWQMDDSNKTWGTILDCILSLSDVAQNKDFVITNIPTLIDFGVWENKHTYPNPWEADWPKS